MRPTTLILTLAVSALVANACVRESKFADRFSEAGCERAKRCWDDANGEFDMKTCKENAKDSAEYLLDECQDYDGGLAWKCLKDIEDQKCDDTEQTKNCKEFDKECGFGSDGQAIIEYEGGMSVYGWGDIRWSAPQ